VDSFLVKDAFQEGASLVCPRIFAQDFRQDASGTCLYSMAQFMADKQFAFQVYRLS
jgi:hypothetical protein